MLTVEYSKQVGYSSSNCANFSAQTVNENFACNNVCAWFKIANLFTFPKSLVNYIFRMQNLFMQVLVQYIFSVFSDTKILRLEINFANFTKQAYLNLRFEFPSALLFHWMFLFLEEIKVVEIVN